MYGWMLCALKCGSHLLVSLAPDAASWAFADAGGQSWARSQAVVRRRTSLRVGVSADEPHPTR